MGKFLWWVLLLVPMNFSKCSMVKRGSVCLQVSGPVFFSSLVSEKLLLTHVTPPLDGCTYLGLDSGAPPLQVTPVDKDESKPYFASSPVFFRVFPRFPCSWMCSSVSAQM